MSKSTSPTRASPGGQGTHTAGVRRAKGVVLGALDFAAPAAVLELWWERGGGRPAAPTAERSRNRFPKFVHPHEPWAFAPQLPSQKRSGSQTSVPESNSGFLQFLEERQARNAENRDSFWGGLNFFNPPCDAAKTTGYTNMSLAHRFQPFVWKVVFGSDHFNERIQAYYWEGVSKLMLSAGGNACGPSQSIPHPHESREHF